MKQSYRCEEHANEFSNRYSNTLQVILSQNDKLDCGYMAKWDDDSGDHEDYCEKQASYLCISSKESI